MQGMRWEAKTSARSWGTGNWWARWEVPAVSESTPLHWCVTVLWRSFQKTLPTLQQVLVSKFRVEPCPSPAVEMPVSTLWSRPALLALLARWRRIKGLLLCCSEGLWWQETGKVPSVPWKSNKPTETANQRVNTQAMKQINTWLYKCPRSAVTAY